MLITILVFLLVLSIVVFVHEIGHFYTAIKLGIGVEEFGFGFPPRIFGIKKKSILYSLNWIPLGGFVKIKGESGDNFEDQDSFMNQAIWKRALVLFAGVFMNWVLAFILLSVGYLIGLPTSLSGSNLSGARISNERVQIAEVYSNSAADLAGLKVGDIILSVNDQKFQDDILLQKYLRDHNDQEFLFLIQRNQKEQYLKVGAKEIPELKQKLLGIGLVKSAIVSYPWYRAPLEALKTVFRITYLIFMALFNLIINLIKGSGGADVSGPIGVAVFAGKAFKMGWIYLLQFTALISINLAVINILPIPALDGGRILFLIIEKIRRKPINQKIEAIVHNIGFALLMVLIILVTYKDFMRYGGNLFQKIKAIF